LASVDIAVKRGNIGINACPVLTKESYCGKACCDETLDHIRFSIEVKLSALPLSRTYYRPENSVQTTVEEKNMRFIINYAFV